MRQNSPEAEGAEAAIPWEGVRALARHWAGGGALFDWLAPDDWEISRHWSADTLRARCAQALLLHLQATAFPYLPRYISDWLDLLEQQIHRVSELTDVPSAHTDWAATLSEFGRYPSALYIERRPRGTFDTPMTRTLKWFCQAIEDAERLVLRALNQQPLSDITRAQLRAALELPEIQGAADLPTLSDFDVAVCTDLGGTWALIARSARQVAGLWRGSIEDQLLALAPILPQIGSQLFELGSLGVAATAIRSAAPSAAWYTRTPLAAAVSGEPCLVAELEQGEWSCWYQTVPSGQRDPNSPYRALTRELGSAPLRPDIWLVADISDEPVEILVECKYSLRGRYIAEGIPQVLAYWKEYPPSGDAQRIHMVVCPHDVVARARSWQGSLVLGTPDHLRELVTAVLDERASDLLTGWE